MKSETGRSQDAPFVKVLAPKPVTEWKEESALFLKQKCEGSSLYNDNAA